jgi:choline dehydrogenase
VGGRNATGEYDPKVHGYSGKVSTSLPWDGPVEHDLRTVKNAELQKEFPITLDVNAGRPMGVSEYSVLSICCNPVLTKWL